MSELELKFCLPDDALHSLRNALRAHGAKRLRLQARYFDTTDGLLARHRIALRLRLEGRRWVQTLKTTGDGAVHRLEHEVRIAGLAKAVPVLDPSRHDGSAAGQALQTVLQTVPDAVLVERHATDVWRLSCLLQDAGGTQIEAALDIGSVSSGARSVPIVELELEHKGGPVQGLFDLATAWVMHGGLWLSTITKAERGQRLLAGVAEHSKPAVTGAKRPSFDAGVNGAGLLRGLLQSTLAQVLANGSEVAEGAPAAEITHQLRVGLRRLRTVLRELAALSPALATEWDGPLSDTFSKLGQRRDQQAVAAAVRPLLEAAGAPLLSWHEPPSADPAAAVREPAFQVTLLAILALAHAGDEQFAALSHKDTLQRVAARLNKLHQQVAHDGRRFERLPIEQQHRVRKQLKRLRYLADLTATLWPRKAVRSYLKRLGAAQDALGVHNDVAVAADAFRSDAALQPDAWFAAGYLQAHLAVTARVARKLLVKVADGGRFWT